MGRLQLHLYIGKRRGESKDSRGSSSRRNVAGWFV